VLRAGDLLALQAEDLQAEALRSDLQAEDL